ncbi:MAG: VWA domain-containing protein [Acidobacteriota bacterium]|nr:VWA domain-containing protein [Acidobacteriota bacterium]
MAIATLLSLFSSTLLAQSSAMRSGASVEVSIVNVDVFVTDKHGNRVHGLTKDDFEIYENGARQPVSNFAEYTGAAGGEVGVRGNDAPQSRQKRNILIFFERMQLPAHAVDPLVASLKGTLAKLVARGDSVGVVMWEPSETMQVDFTDDLTVVDAALDKVAKEAKEAQIDKARIVREEAAMMRDFQANAAAFANRRRAATLGGGGGGVSNSSFKPPTPQITGGDGWDTQLALLTAYTEMQQRVAAIQSAIDTLASAEGKKILLLATRRLGEVAGAEFVYALGAQRIDDHARARYSTAALLDKITDSANAGGVTVYPVYPIGLGTSMDDTTGIEAPDLSQSVSTAELLTLQNERFGMQKVAERTGGLTAAGFKDIINLLPRITDDVTDYYSLAYRVSSAKTDRARDIVVKTRNRDLVVRSRRQFVEKSEETQMHDRMIAALFRVGTQPPIPVTAQTGAIRKVNHKLVVPVAVQVPIAWLTMLPRGDGKVAGEFSIYAGAAADLDELSDLTRKSQPFEIEEKELERARSGYFTYDLQMTVNEKTKYLAVGVFDEVGKSYGTVRLEMKTGEGK